MSAVKVSLIGGPEHLPQESRTRLVADLSEPVKIVFNGGYEHFVHHGEYVDDGFEKVAVYHWSDRTRMAE
ncbi:DUF5988 family protein [Amycolatopsis australiensis]|uniref:Uncharacterized protein n=1 Tax=Amycolatopsis australiensis TaxID=546364 RepID=A0A1K1SX06_9PSEU|nr:DUF5988 family protein [Amycolatopsis australiensis]SFW88591.1 hypothetical protein SAMN04489730_7005 [Amycolatopsis australiensis]